MSLFAERFGEGHDVICLHGWGLHGGFCRDLGKALARSNRIHLFDLPGHGYSAETPCPDTITKLSDQIVSQHQEPATWIGWSLGGMIALDVAIRFPERVNRLVLISSTPRFVQGADWQPAMSAGTFASFVSSLIEQPVDTVMRFLSLQASGDDAGRHLIKQLRHQAGARRHPSSESLEHGLRILGETDLRNNVDKIRAPTIVIHGDNDRIVPPDAGRWIAAKVPNARFESIPRAGHAPFLSHPQAVAGTVERFLA